MKNRPYQTKAEDEVFRLWNEEQKRSILAVMPTGTGKTILFASIIRRMFPRRALVIAHRQELIWQARDKIQQVTGLHVDIEMGEFKARMDGDLLKPRASVIVATVQTLTAGGDGAGRLGKLDPRHFGLVIIDEAHHAPSESYSRVLGYMMTNKNLKVLGVTATPDRSDEVAMGRVFDAVAIEYGVLEAITDGWLVPIYQQMVAVDPMDLSKIKTTAGDLNGKDLEAVLKQEKVLLEMASSIIQIVGARRGIGFAASVEHARLLSSIFNRPEMGFTGHSAIVSANTDPDERKLIISEFAQGRIQWLWNCGVFTEGFDDPGVEVIAMCRPTKSRSLYTQMAGRATRPHASISGQLNNVPIAALRRSLITQSIKPSCLIIDFVGNSGKHKLITTADVLGGDMSDDAISAATAYARKMSAPVRMDNRLKIEEEEQEKRKAAAKARQLAEDARKANLSGKATFKVTNVDPFDLLDIKPVKSKGWDEGKSLSERQRKILRDRGYDPDKMPYGQAKQLVGIIMERLTNKKCTLKQVALLERVGWSKAEASEMGFEQASKALDAAKANSWKKPESYDASDAKSVEVLAEVGDDNVPF